MQAFTVLILAPDEYAIRTGVAVHAGLTIDFLKDNN